LLALCESLEEVAGDPAARAVILTGAGTRFFCAGGDVKELAGLPMEAGLERVRNGIRLLRSLSALGKPLVCAVNGTAAGGGTLIPCFGDHRVAVPHARFGMPEIDHGILPMAKGMQQMARVLGLRTARRLLYSGEIVGAPEALELGMVDEIVPPEELADRAEAWARTMAAKDPRLFGAIKRTLAGSEAMTDEALEAVTVADFEAYFQTPRMRSTLEGFLERDRPG